MKTVEIKVFNIKELSEKAKQKAIDDNRDWNVEYIQWWDCIYEEFKEKAEEKGFSDPKIWFSGFCSQGDGACFDAEIDLNELINWVADKNKYKHLIPFIEEGTISASIGKTSYANHYNHERTRYVELEHPFYSERCPRSFKLCSELQEELEEIRYDLSRELYRALEKEYEYLTSDELIEERLEINEVQFTEDGRVFNY
jgi:hypothetical protein